MSMLNTLITLGLLGSGAAGMTLDSDGSTPIASALLGAGLGSGAGQLANRLGGTGKAANALFGATKGKRYDKAKQKVLGSSTQKELDTADAWMNASDRVERIRNIQSALAKRNPSQIITDRNARLTKEKFDTIQTMQNAAKAHHSALKEGNARRTAKANEIDTNRFAANLRAIGAAEKYTPAALAGLAGATGAIMGYENPL